MWNTCLGTASNNNHKKLIVYFILKGANNITWGLTCATEGRYKDLVNFFTSRYRPYNWSLPLYCTIEKGYTELIDFFRESIIRDDIVWDGIKKSIKGNHLNILNFFISEATYKIPFLTKDGKMYRFLKKVGVTV